LPYITLLFSIRNPTKNTFAVLVGKSTNTSAAEPARAAHALLELLHLEHLGRVDALEHQLRDPVALLDGEIGVRVVEEEDLDLAAVVGVDDARARVDEVFGRQAGARGDAAV